MIASALYFWKAPYNLSYFLLLTNKADIILNTITHFEPWFMYVHKHEVKGIIGNENWGKSILNINIEN